MCKFATEYYKLNIMTLMNARHLLLSGGNYAALKQANATDLVEEKLYILSRRIVNCLGASIS